MGLSSFNRMRRLKAEREAQILERNERAYTEYTAQEIGNMNAKEQKAFIEKHNLAIDGYKSMKASEVEQALLTFLGFETSDTE